MLATMLDLFRPGPWEVAYNGSTEYKIFDDIIDLFPNTYYKVENRIGLDSDTLTDLEDHVINALGEMTRSSKKLW